MQREIWYSHEGRVWHFHKGKFYIQTITKVENGKPIEWGVEEKEGWINANGTYGFHKVKYNVWIATDIASGARVAKAATRKACAEFIDANKVIIQRAKESDDYKVICKRLFKIMNGVMLND